MNYDDYGFPTEIVYLGRNICDSLADFTNEEVIADVVSDVLAEEYGCCNNGFDYEYLYAADGVPTAIVVYDIEWDYDASADEDEDEDEFEDEEEDPDPDTPAIYTHNEAANIIDYFEDILCANEIKVPSPEDDERDPDDQYGLYGSTYGDLLDIIEERLIDIIERAKTARIVSYEFE